MKIKFEVEDNEFPSWPPFPEHLKLMWAGIREEMLQKIMWVSIMIPPIFPFLAGDLWLSDEDHQKHENLIATHSVKKS